MRSPASTPSTPPTSAAFPVIIPAPRARKKWSVYGGHLQPDGRRDARARGADCRDSAHPGQVRREPPSVDVPGSRCAPAAVRGREGPPHDRAIAAARSRRSWCLRARRFRRPALHWHRQDVDRPWVSARGDRSRLPGADGGVPGKVRPANRFHHDQRSDLADRHARGVHRPPAGDRGCRGGLRPVRQSSEAAAQPRAARRDRVRPDCKARDGSDTSDGAVQ